MSFSLTGAVRTATVNAGYAPNMESTRIFNIGDLVCPVWTGYDDAGRPVNRNTFVDVTAGCSDPMDRVSVETALRPRYTEYVTLSATGLNANVPPYLQTAPEQQGLARRAMLDVATTSGPSFGNQFDSNLRNTNESIAVMQARDARMNAINAARPSPQSLVNVGSGAYSRTQDQMAASMPVAGGSSIPPAGTMTGALAPVYPNARAVAPGMGLPMPTSAAADAVDAQRLAQPGVNPVQAMEGFRAGGQRERYSAGRR